MSEENSETQSKAINSSSGTEKDGEQPQADLDKEIIEEYKKIMKKKEEDEEEFEGVDSVEEMQEGVQYGI